MIFKKLFFDLLLHLEHIFFLNQMITAKGNANQVSAFCCRDLFYGCLFK